MTPSTPPSPLSDVSFASVNSSFTTPPKATPTFPPHASTSTISRSSHTSLPQPPPHPPLPPHLLPSSSTTRLPKARVFLSRPSSPAPTLTPHNRRPTSPHPPPPHHSKPPLQKQQPRCISDLVSISTQPYHRHHPHHHHHNLPADAINFLREDPQLPPWLPPDELRDWNPTPPPPPHHHHHHQPPHDDPCTESRWVTSLRNLSHLYKSRDRDATDLRGSVLEIRPPSLAERLGLPQRRKKTRGMAAHAAHADVTGDAGVRIVEAEEFGCEGRGDEYVGFLGGEVKVREAKKGRRAWWRFLTRSG